MNKIQITKTDVGFTDPHERIVRKTTEGEVEESFSIDVSGNGELTGLAYTVPAHSQGNIKANLQMSAISSEDIKNLNNLAMGMLEVSEKEQAELFMTTSVQGNLSIFGSLFGGGADASFESTYNTMKSRGLTEAQISTLMDAFLEMAQRMSTVEIDFFINNSANDYSVDGSLYLYTISGEIITSKGTAQYRMLADAGNAGGPPPSGGGAPSTGQVIPLN